MLTDLHLSIVSWTSCSLSGLSNLISLPIFFSEAILGQVLLWVLLMASFLLFVLDWHMSHSKQKGHCRNTVPGPCPGFPRTQRQCQAAWQEIPEEHCHLQGHPASLSPGLPRTGRRRDQGSWQHQLHCSKGLSFPMLSSLPFSPGVMHTIY